MEFVSYEFGESEIDRARKANAYVMLQYTRGRSGLRPDRDPKLAARLNRLRDEGVTLPIVAGIGVSTVEQARQAMDHGAGRSGDRIESSADGGVRRSALEDYLSEVREALNHD